MPTAFIYTDRSMDFSYGPSHPMRLIRLKLTYELVKASGLLDRPETRLVEIEPAAESDLRRFHTEDYLTALRLANDGKPEATAWRFGLGSGDNPVFRGVYDLARLAGGASLQAARLVASGEVDIAFNIAGGLHHARPDRASGFCYVNDAVLAIGWLLEQGYRVAYVDIDAHHGDGVEAAFYDTDQVLTISIHESGYFLFPGTGFETDLGNGAGEGYAINVPLLPGAGDETFIWAFDEVVPPLLRSFQPDVVVTQLGCDTFATDPLTHLQMTTHGFTHALTRFKELCPRWVALGGGGYDIGNVARAWTLAWAIMNGVELPDELPAAYRDFARRHGVADLTLRDQPHPGWREANARQEAERVVAFLRKRAFCAA